MFFKLYVITLPALLLLDYLWLGIVAKKFYSDQIGFLLRPHVNWAAAIAFYVLYAGAVVVFVAAPASQRESWMHALLYGAFFGLTAYAAYDLTNLATLKNWPLTVSIVDMAWGAVITATASVLTVLISSRLYD